MPKRERIDGVRGPGRADSGDVMEIRNLRVAAPRPFYVIAGIKDNAVGIDCHPFAHVGFRQSKASVNRRDINVDLDFIECRQV
jgi:hypothetical protein